MPKRAVDLSVGELGAMGAKAALSAVHKAQKAGLVITGTIDIYEKGQAASSLAQALPSGTVTLIRQGAGELMEEAVSTKPPRGRTVD